MNRPLRPRPDVWRPTFMSERRSRVQYEDSAPESRYREDGWGSNRDTSYRYEKRNSGGSERWRDERRRPAEPRDRRRDDRYDDRTSSWRSQRSDAKPYEDRRRRDEHTDPYNARRRHERYERDEWPRRDRREQSPERTARSSEQRQGSKMEPTPSIEKNDDIEPDADQIAAMMGFENFGSSKVRGLKLLII